MLLLMYGVLGAYLVDMSGILPLGEVSPCSSCLAPIRRHPLVSWHSASWPLGAFEAGLMRMVMCMGCWWVVVCKPVCTQGGTRLRVFVIWTLWAPGLVCAFWLLQSACLSLQPDCQDAPLCSCAWYQGGCMCSFASPSCACHACMHVVSS